MVSMLRGTSERAALDWATILALWIPHRLPLPLPFYHSMSVVHKIQQCVSKLVLIRILIRSKVPTCYLPGISLFIFGLLTSLWNE